MKRMTYKTLMKKIEDGYAEVYAWEGTVSHGECCAIVIFYKANGDSRREMVQVTNIPEDFER